MYVSRLANKGNKVLCATYTKDIKKALRLPLDFIYRSLGNIQDFQIIVLDNLTNCMILRRKK